MNVVLLLAWLAFAWPTSGWLGAGWVADGDGQAQLVVAVALAALLLRERSALRPGAASWPALALAVGLPLASLLAPHLDSVRAAAVVGSGFGVLGLFLPRDRWVRLGAAPLAGLAVLPVTPMVDAILGWPLRKALAAAAAAVLGGIPLEAVLSVEGTVTHVDVPCAGVRSLWALAALVLLVAVHRRVPVGPRLILALGVGATAALAANLVRVVAVVGISANLGWPLLADTVHRPLGVIGFAGALGLALLALPQAQELVDAPIARESSWVRPLVAAILVAAALVRPQAVPAEVLPVPELPAGFVRVAPSPGEQAFADERGSTLVKGTLDGASVAVVASRSWLAHHVPTRCLEAAGWTPGADELVRIGDREVRRVAVTRGADRATAIWWFQSGDRVTDDLVVRIRDGWATGRPWTLVSVLVPDGVDPLPVLADLREVSW